MWNTLYIIRLEVLLYTDFYFVCLVLVCYQCDCIYDVSVLEFVLRFVVLSYMYNLVICYDFVTLFVYNGFIF